MDKLLFDLLSPLDELEKKQRSTGKVYEEFATKHLRTSSAKLPNQLFFAGKQVVIRRHRRFAKYPLHSHQFLEFNYMLAGSSKQIVNGDQIVLQPKQLLLLDANSKHELAPLGEKDLLINFLFKIADLNLDFIKKMDQRSNGITYNFILNAILTPNNQENYLLLDLKQKLEIQNTLEQMIIEYFTGTFPNIEIMDAYMQLLFLQLSRTYYSQLTSIYKQAKDANIIIPILQIIENEYRTITLQELAVRLGYNKNYLSNLIKAKTGKTFTDLLTREKLHRAHQLFISTSVSIDGILDYVGYSNKTQFYKKFKEYFHTTPKQLREHSLPFNQDSTSC